MQSKNFSSSFTTAKSPAEVFAALSNVRGWWSEGLKGESDKLNGEFVYQHKAIHLSTQKVVELVPNQRVVWQVTQSRLSFVDKKDEWTGTQVAFDIAREGGKTRLTMTHKGLSPALACYQACSGGWNFYFGESLRKLIDTGKGEPDPATA